MSDSVERRRPRRRTNVEDAAEGGGAPPNLRRLYAFVIGFLVFEIVLFHLFTRAFQ